MRAPFVEHASGDQNRKSAFVSGAVVETVCTLCHIRLSAYHRSSPNVGWPRFRAVLMLTAIVPASAIGWNGTKVGSVIHRDLISKISGQNKTRVAPDIPPLLNRGDPILCYSYLTRAALGFRSLLPPYHHEPLCSRSPLTSKFLVRILGESHPVSFRAEKQGNCPQSGGFGQ